MLFKNSQSGAASRGYPIRSGRLHNFLSSPWSVSGSSYAVLVSANAVAPPVPFGGSSCARRIEHPARRGLKDESQWKGPLPKPSCQRRLSVETTLPSSPRLLTSKSSV